MVEEHTWLRKSSWNEKDEYYTPKILVEAIIPHLQKGKTIWCPFDTANSEFVLCLQEAGYRVLHTHLWMGQDFFEYEPSIDYDYIISNPPFTLKLKVFKRLFELGKPFAMVMGLPILNYQEVGSFFHSHQEDENYLQLLIVDKKVSFDGNTASFNNSYFCWNLLERDIIFHHLENNNSRKHYIPSRMFNDVGFYALQNYKKGDLILTLIGEVFESPTRYSIEIEPTIHIEDENGKYMNHSFTPNCIIDGYDVIALKDIKKGIELTFDYHTTESNLAYPFKDKETDMDVVGNAN